MTSGDAAGQTPVFRMLIDTNIFITAEPYSGQLEAEIDVVNSMLRLADEQGHAVFVHPASRDELAVGGDQVRAQQRLAEFNRYQRIEESPISSALKEGAGDSTPGTNDHFDLRYSHLFMPGQSRTLLQTIRN